MTRSISDRVTRRWHDWRAYHFRGLCVELHLESYDPRNNESFTLRLLEGSDRAAIKAKYHEQMARTYDPVKPVNRGGK